VVYGGVNYKSSRIKKDQVKHIALKESLSIIIKIKRDAQGKGTALLGFRSSRSRGRAWSTR
jgi:hypothetical protein